MKAVVLKEYGRAGFVDVADVQFPPVTELIISSAFTEEIPPSRRRELVARMLGLGTGESLPAWASTVDGVRLIDDDTVRFSTPGRFIESLNSKKTN